MREVSWMPLSVALAKMSADLPFIDEWQQDQLRKCGLYRRERPLVTEEILLRLQVRARARARVMLGYARVRVRVRVHNTGCMPNPNPNPNPIPNPTPPAGPWLGVCRQAGELGAARRDCRA